MLFDTHTHIAPYSHDASQTIGQLLEQADQIGLEGICVTDHYEKDLFYDGREDIFDLTEYFRALLPVQARRPDGSARLTIGVELGYLPHLSGHLSEIANKYPFDNIIMSIHILDGEDPFTDERAYAGGKEDVYTRYLQRLGEMVLACPDIDIVGHFDYISRYAPFPDRKMRYAEMPEAFDRLFRIMVGQQKALEINTRTTAKLQKNGYAGDEAWPDPAIIRRYLELGGRLISLGSDAHHPQQAGSLVFEGARWLKGQNCSHIVHYEKRQAILSPL